MSIRTWWLRLQADVLDEARTTGYAEGLLGLPHRRHGLGHVQKVYDLAYGRGRMARIEKEGT
jgi:hypothetical protein